jgi:importin subunit beta-1
MQLLFMFVSVSKQDAPKISDHVIQALLQMLSGPGLPGGRSVGVQEDALMAISTLTEVLGEDFVKYMDSFRPFLVSSLQNISESAVSYSR